MNIDPAAVDALAAIEGIAAAVAADVSVMIPLSVAGVAPQVGSPVTAPQANPAAASIAPQGANPVLPSYDADGRGGEY